MAKNFYTEKFVNNNTFAIPNKVTFKNLTGQKFGKIVVVSWAGINKYGDWKNKRNAWWCKCNCGETNYFLVDPQSLLKGLSTSCGCNYKKNGSSVATSKVEAEKALKQNYKLLKYGGRKYPCEVECVDCGDKETFDTFYSVQQRVVWCSCKDKDTLVRDIVEKVNYTFLRRSPSDKYKIEASCNSCGFVKVAAANYGSWLDECPCKHDIEMTDQTTACVYFNVDELNPTYYKIGKAIEPYSRLNQVMTSVIKNGYDNKHRFKIKHMKWFKNEKVAYQVESLYHQWLKDKAVYGYKGTKAYNSVFDGSNELFDVTKKDIEDFNKLYKSVLDSIERDKPEYIILKDFSSDMNIQKPKGRLVVNVWFPRKGKLYDYMKLKGCPWKDDIVDNSNSLIEAYKKIRIREKELLFEVEGKYYDSCLDFYEQWCHLSAVSYKTFRDRVFNKNRDVWEALTFKREKKVSNKVYDLDGSLSSFQKLYDKYSPYLSYTSFKDRLVAGEDLKTVINTVPIINMTKVYLYVGKYYSNTQLYDKLNPAVSRATFNTRIAREWDITIAAFVPQSNKYDYKVIKDNLENLYPEIYQKILTGGVSPFNPS